MDPYLTGPCSVLSVMAVDLTADGVRDHLLRLNNGTVHGLYWVVDGADGRVILDGRAFTGGGYRVVGGDLVERAPTYRRGDAGANPTGRVIATRFSWDPGARMLVKWGGRGPRPSSAPIPTVVPTDLDAPEALMERPPSINLGQEACGATVDALTWQTWTPGGSTAAGTGTFRDVAPGEPCG